MPDNRFTQTKAQIQALLDYVQALTPTTTELNYVDGVTSAIQTQIDGLSSGISDNAGNISALQTTVGEITGRTLLEYAYPISTSDHVSGSWNTFVTNNPTYSLAAGTYLINYVVTVKGTAATDGTFTTRLWDSTSGAEVKAGTFGTRQTALVNSSVITTVSASVFLVVSAQTTFNFYPQMYSTQTYSPRAAALSVMKIV